MTYEEVQRRLEEIDAELGRRLPDLENAARSYFTAKRDFEHTQAVAYLQTQGTVDERRQRTIVAIYQSEAYKTLVTSEANWEALKAVTRTLETRASIGQSLLRAIGRETGG